jgi:hypothetical protein
MDVSPGGKSVAVPPTPCSQMVSWVEEVYSPLQHRTQHPAPGSSPALRASSPGDAQRQPGPHRLGSPPSTAEALGSKDLTQYSVSESILSLILAQVSSQHRTKGICLLRALPVSHHPKHSVQGSPRDRAPASPTISLPQPPWWESVQSKNRFHQLLVSHPAEASDIPQCSLRPGELSPLALRRWRRGASQAIFPPPTDLHRITYHLHTPHTYLLPGSTQTPTHLILLTSAFTG